MTIKYYCTRCKDGHVWGTGFTKSQSRKNAEEIKKEQGYEGVKLLPSEQTSKATYLHVSDVGDNVTRLEKFKTIKGVLYLKSERLEDAELDFDNFELLSIDEKLSLIWEKLNEK